MTLNDLAVKNVTDKWEACHDYCPIYEALFSGIRDSVKNVVEVGIETGGSIRMWRDFFSNAVIHGIDIVSCNDSGERTKGYIADQSQPDQLISVMNQIGEQPEIIIDDGSHAISDIVITLKTLYPYLKSGGIYCIEDLENARKDMEEYLQGYDYWFATSKSPILNSNIIIIRKP